MFFAAIDLIRYVGRSRRYSTKALIQDGYRLAIEANFSGDRTPPAGTIIIKHTRLSLLSWSIMYFTESAASHSALSVGRGYIVEMTTAGATLHPLADHLDGKSWLFTGSLPGVTRKQTDAAVDVALSRVGQVKFGWEKLVYFGWAILSGRTYWNPRNWRLWVDCILLLTVPSFRAITSRRGLNKFSRLAIGAYALVLVTNEVKRTRWLKRRKRPPDADPVLGPTRPPASRRQ